jgi:hypothetical protein
VLVFGASIPSALPLSLCAFSAATHTRAQDGAPVVVWSWAWAYLEVFSLWPMILLLAGSSLGAKNL